MAGFAWFPKVTRKVYFLLQKNRNKKAKAGGKGLVIYIVTKEKTLKINLVQGLLNHSKRSCQVLATVCFEPILCIPYLYFISPCP